MKYEQAIEKLQEAEGPLLVLNYRDYRGHYVFQTCPEGTMILPFMPIMGGYFAVNKTTGEVQKFNPKVEPEFFESEETDLYGLREIEKMITELKPEE